MFDLIITGGTAVMPASTEAADIGVAGGKIVAIGAPGSLAAVGAGRTVDAAGQIVIPGGIDPHIHCGMPIVGGPSERADLRRAAVAGQQGGAVWRHDDDARFRAVPAGDQPLQQSIEARQREWAGACYYDYGFHLMLRGTQHPGTARRSCPRRCRPGTRRSKIFTTDITPLSAGPHGQVRRHLGSAQVAGARGRARGDPRRGQRHRHAHVREADPRGAAPASRTWPRCTTRCREDLSFSRVIRLAENVEGAALYMVHVSAATGVAAIAEARARGFPIYGETLHQYLLYTAEDYKRPNGQMYHTYPSLKYAEDQTALWDGTSTARSRRVATDEVCCPLQGQAAGRAHRRHDRRQFRRRAARVADVHARLVDEARLQPRRICRSGLDQRGEDHGPLPAQGRAGGRLATPISCCSTRARRARRAEETARDRLHAVGRPRRRRWPCMTILRGKIVVEGGALPARPATASSCPARCRTTSAPAPRCKPKHPGSRRRPGPIDPPIERSTDGSRRSPGQREGA